MYQHIILNCLLRLDATVVLVGGRPCTGLFKLLVDKFFKLHAALVNTRVVNFLQESVLPQLFPGEDRFTHPNRTEELYLFRQIVTVLTKRFCDVPVFVVGQESASMHQLMFLGLPTLSVVESPTERTRCHMTTHFPTFAVHDPAACATYFHPEVNDSLVLFVAHVLGGA